MDKIVITFLQSIAVTQMTLGELAIHLPVAKFPVVWN